LHIAFEIESWVIIFGPKLITRCRIVIISETFFVFVHCAVLCP